MSTRKALEDVDKLKSKASREPGLQQSLHQEDRKQRLKQAWDGPPQQQRRDRTEQREQSVQRDHIEQREQRGQRDHIEQRDHRDHRDQEDMLAGLDKRQLMERIRFEVAQELGMEKIVQGELGEATTAQCGKFGALLQKRTQHLLKIRHVPKNKHK
ncbi:small, acid-soluble spore protein, alpha/beta type [Alicyclobacillus sp. SO9]|uniref:small, acid-soluble spore protein, alpha/beta type n=1 Tax=Alicyclobacillus sp. SO9 TaxID=2665646 RepID=UPI0018E80724|nr:small, acid-soluble spore protein, alpha/beta type [Alicyclobacillus sp. SO9]QQE78877.1 small, acid-soluble spore protein, alpha/beta type [Alicyclobacillus sp. SO9]